MASVVAFISRNWQLAHQPVAAKAPDPIKFGLLGATKIAPTALLAPAKTHPGVVIQAVAARDKSKAEAYAKKHDIPQVMESYDEMLDDQSIDAVYVALPPALHYEWAMKAINKGKHVLLEKPGVINTTEAESLFRLPRLQAPNPPVLLEAVHCLFQPAWSHFLAQIDRPNLKAVTCTATLPSYMIPVKDNIRFNYDLGGGNILDLGTYALYALRRITAAEPEECTECDVRLSPSSELCDEAANMTFRFPGGVIGKAITDLRASMLSLPTFNITVFYKEVELEDSQLPKGQKRFRVRKLTFNNFIMCAVEHSIVTEDELSIRENDGTVVKRWTTKESTKVFTFKDAGIDQPSDAIWSSFRHQLEQFVNRVRGREGSGLWVTAEDSIAQAKVIDMAYTKSGLPLRRSSGYVQ